MGLDAIGISTTLESNKAFDFIEYLKYHKRSLPDTEADVSLQGPIPPHSVVAWDFFSWACWSFS